MGNLLVLLGHIRGVNLCTLHTEVIVDFSRIDGSSGLGDEFGSSHGLTIPERGVIQGDFHTLCATRVCWILESRIQVDV